MAVVVLVSYTSEDMVIRQFLFDYNRLDSFLIEGQKSPDWTDGELTMFRDNCRKYVVNSLEDTRKCLITINESTGEVTINGQKDLKDKFSFLPT